MRCPRVAIPSMKFGCTLYRVFRLLLYGTALLTEGHHKYIIRALLAGEATRCHKNQTCRLHIMTRVGQQSGTCRESFHRSHDLLLSQQQPTTNMNTTQASWKPNQTGLRHLWDDMDCLSQPRIPRIFVTGAAGGPRASYQAHEANHRGQIQVEALLEIRFESPKSTWTC